MLIMVTMMREHNNKGEKKMTFTKWFNTFLEEKDLTPQSWELVDREGVTHWIGSDVVIEAIHNCSAQEQAGIKNMLVKIDFMNGDVMDYFKHLAGALINR